MSKYAEAIETCGGAKDERRHNFYITYNVIVDEYLPKIGTTAFAIYGILLRHANEADHTCFPSLKRIGELTGIKDRRTLRGHLDKLEEQGLIRQTHNHLFRRNGKGWRGTLYTIVGTPKPREGNFTTLEDQGEESLHPREGIPSSQGREFLQGEQDEVIEQDKEKETRAREDGLEKKPPDEQPAAKTPPAPAGVDIPPADTCPYDPAFPCHCVQAAKGAIREVTPDGFPLDNTPAFHQVAHAWPIPDMVTLYAWLVHKKAPDDSTWWHTGNAFSPKHRDTNLWAAREWAAKREARRSVAACPHPPERIGYNPLLGRYHCFACFEDLAVEVAMARGCDEHLDPEPFVTKEDPC